MIVSKCAKCKRELKMIEMRHEFYLGLGKMVYLCGDCTGKMRGIIRDWLDGAQVTIVRHYEPGEGAITDSATMTVREVSG